MKFCKNFFKFNKKGNADTTSWCDVLSNAAFDYLPQQMKVNESWISDLTPPFGVIENTVTGQIWKETPGGHKWLDYFPIYDREFSRFVGKSPKVLEIGIYRGASLELWKKFFGSDSTIVGVDIDPTCAQFQNPNENIFVEIGSQADNQFLSNIAEKYGPFDLVIDDGSHVSSHQIASFNALFDLGLRNDGLYFVEDLECIYWGNTDEYRDMPITSMDFFKMLVDIQNGIFSRYEYSDFALHTGHAKEVFSAPKLAKFVSSIRFYRGITVVEKSANVPPRVLHI